MGLVVATTAPRATPVFENPGFELQRVLGATNNTPNMTGWISFKSQSFYHF
jgi:hypothetical protein